MPSVREHSLTNPYVLLQVAAAAAGLMLVMGGFAHASIGPDNIQADLQAGAAGSSVLNTGGASLAGSSADAGGADTAADTAANSSGSPDERDEAKKQEECAKAKDEAGKTGSSTAEKKADDTCGVNYIVKGTPSSSSDVAEGKAVKTSTISLAPDDADSFESADAYGNDSGNISMVRTKAVDTAAYDYPDETAKGMGATGSGAQYAADYQAGQADVANGTINESGSVSNGYMAGVAEAKTNTGVSLYSTGIAGTKSLEAAGVLKPTPITNIGGSEIVLSNNTSLGADARDQANYYQTGWAGKTRVGSSEPYEFVSFEEGSQKGIAYGWTEETMTSDFGARSSPCSGCSSNHKGNDYSIGPGMNGNAMVQSGVNGKVIYAGNVNGYGQTVKVQAEDGTVYQFSHLEQGSINVAVGDEVVVGSKVGEVGSTGLGTGSHLHYGVYENGVAINPQTNTNYDVASANTWSNTSGQTVVPTYNVASTAATAGSGAGTAGGNTGLTLGSGNNGVSIGGGGAAYAGTGGGSYNTLGAATSAAASGNSAGGFNLANLMGGASGSSGSIGGNSSGTGTASSSAGAASGGTPTPYSYDMLMAGLTDCVNTKVVETTSVVTGTDGAQTSTTERSITCADDVDSADSV